MLYSLLLEKKTLNQRLSSFPKKNVLKNVTLSRDNHVYVVGNLELGGHICT